MGRTRGSKNKPKDQSTLPLTQERSRPAQSTLFSTQVPSSEDGSSDEEEETALHTLKSTVDSSLKRLSREIQHVLQDLKRIERDFDKAINLIEKRMDDIEVQNKQRDEKIKILELKVEELTKANKQHTDSINVQERFSRRNNLRIVGFSTSDGENPLEIAKGVLEKVGIPNVSIERAHRDGRFQPTRPRHILVKLSFYQDKLTALKQQRSKLANESFFITDDLTKSDLAEKRKWSRQVSELYRAGTKLRFSAGKWRDSNGKQYDFREPPASS